MTTGNEIAVIGAGHNGLTAAALLAKAGQKVTVYEARERVGGLAARHAFGEGYAVFGVLHDTSGVREAIVDSLGLARFGLKRRAAPAVCAPREEGEPIWIEGEALRGATDRDAAGYQAWRDFLRRVRPALSAWLDAPPPEPTRELWPTVKAALSVRRLGSADMLELLRVAPMCVADWMRDRFASERLSSALALPAVLGEYLGPWSAGSGLSLLMQEAVRGPEIEGGPAALIEALRQAAEGFGATVHTATPVERIELEAGRVRGLVLAGGERIAVGRVLATCDPKQTFLKLIGSHRLPVELAEDMRQLRARGTAVKVHLALSGPLELSDGTAVEALRTGETLDAIERAFDAVKYRRMSERPVLDVRVPSMHAGDLVPEEGHHVVSILAGFAPHALEGGWRDEQREAFGDRAVSELGRYCPKLPERIVHREVLTPADLDATFRLTGGHLLHGEHAMDQVLFMRPSVECAKYATPIAGLYLGGSGSHPGGGITCAPGALAARAILAQR